MMGLWLKMMNMPHLHHRHHHHLHYHPLFLPIILNHLPSSINRRTIISCSNYSSPLQSLTSEQKEQIDLYISTLLQWNERMNLTAITNPIEVMERHVKDSLAIIPPIQSVHVTRYSSPCTHLKLVDVGSGAGLPGLILAIACPDWKVTLLESMQKRCLFLEHVVALTGLSNVQVVRERAENAGQNLDFREAFDVAVARAVAEMRILAEYCVPLVRVGGFFVAAKGYDPQEEVRNAKKAIQLMGASIFQLCSGYDHFLIPKYSLKNAGLLPLPTPLSLHLNLGEVYSTG